MSMTVNVDIGGTFTDFLSAGIQETRISPNLQQPIMICPSAF